MIQYIVILGVVISLFGIWVYVKDTLSGKTKPNRVTWLMWTIAPLIGCAISISQGVTWAVAPTLMAGLGPLVVLIASFANKQSYWHYERFDFLCLALSVVALILWLIIKEPNIALLFAILSDGTAAVPTLKKSWLYPKTETNTIYFMGIINCVLSFFAFKSWTFAEYGFPIYFIAINSLILLVLYYRKKINNY